MTMSTTALGLRRILRIVFRARQDRTSAWTPVVMGLICLVARAAPGDVITVCPDGSCDHTTIQAGVDAAEPGDIVEIGAGEWVLECDPYRTAVSFSGKGDIVIRGVRGPDGEWLTRLRAPDGIYERWGFASTTDLSEMRYDAVVFQDLEFFGVEGAAPMYCIEAWHSPIELRSCRFRDISTAGVATQFISDVLRVVDCEFVDVDTNQLPLLDARVTRLEVVGCRFERCGPRRHYLGFGTNPLVKGEDSDMVIRRCEFIDCCRISETGAEQRAPIGLDVEGSLSVIDTRITGLKYAGYASQPAAIIGEGLPAGFDVEVVRCSVDLNELAWAPSAMIAYRYPGADMPDFMSVRVEDSVFCGNWSDWTGDWVPLTPATLPWTDLGGNTVVEGTCPSFDCPADLDGDGRVSVGDLSLLTAAWGPCPSCSEDLDGDGRVGGRDLATLFAAWGPCP